MKIDEEGLCNACRSSEQKETAIDWKDRERAFRALVEKAKSRGNGYDCLIPVSGGKDSTWQVVKCLEYGLNPLTVTWKTPGRTKIGQDNLDNLVSLGVDHVDYRVNPRVEAKFMIMAFEKLGTPALPMHMALFNIPLKLSCRLGIPLVIWGENSAFEYGGDDEDKGCLLNSTWLRNHGVTHGTTADDWASDRLTRKELTPYYGPTDNELADHNVRAVFLGHYFRWDPEESLRVARAHGFQVRREGSKTGYYNYADIDCDFISIHHFIKWYKFGFTRLFDNLSVEIRNGRIRREEALEILRELGDQRPDEDIDKFCRFTATAVTEFNQTLENFRNHEIWWRDQNTWKIRGFIVSDWEWR